MYSEPGWTPELKICFDNGLKTSKAKHCVKSVRIRSYSGSYSPAFGLNTERYETSHRIQSMQENTDQSKSEHEHFSRWEKASYG